MRTLIRFALPVLLAAAAVVATLMPRRAQAELADLGAAPAFAFRTLDGTELTAPALKGKVVVVDFWATWCPPCVKEMPEIDRFRAALVARGGEVVGIAVDSPTPVREFLRRTPVGYPIALAGFEGSDLSRRLGNERGALPFTVLFGRDGRIVQRKLGETTADELQTWLALL